MADDLGEDGQWRGTVEARLGTLEASVEERATLRAAMDVDVADLKGGLGADRNLLRSLHDTQQEHTSQFGQLDEKMRKGFEQVHAGIDAILGLLGGNPDSTGSRR